jgi:hypothetical protein
LRVGSYRRAHELKIEIIEIHRFLIGMVKLPDLEGSAIFVKVAETRCSRRRSGTEVLQNTVSKAISKVVSKPPRSARSLAVAGVVLLGKAKLWLGRPRL